MVFCKNCGKEIGEDSGFCPYCGSAVEAPAAGAGEGAGTPAPPPPPPPPAAPPSYVPEPAQPVGAGMPPVPPAPVGGAPKKSKLPWIIGSVAAVAVIAAVALVLVFVVFKGEGGGNGGGEVSDTQAIEKVVNALFESIEKQDLDGILGVVEPDFLDELKEELGKDYESIIEDEWLSFFEDVEFELRKLDVKIDGDEAEVQIVEGAVTYIDENGKKVTDEAGEGGDTPDAIELVKVDGKWYVAKDSLTDLGLDPDLLSLDFDGEDGDTDGDFTGEVVLPVDSEDEVLAVLMQEQEVYDWVMATAMPDYEITDEGDTYSVYLFEYDEDYNEIPFGRYVIEKESGEITLAEE